MYVCMSTCVYAILMIHCSRSHSSSCSASSHISSGKAALAERDRVRMLHKAKSLSDAKHAVDKAASENHAVSTRGAKKRKLVAAAPHYLKRRVERGEEVPVVRIKKVRGGNKEVKAVLDYVIGGEMAPDMFVELMEGMVPRWDDEARPA